MKKLKIAVTGNIGAGKSTVCEFLKKLNYDIIDADSVAKSILNSDPEVRKNICNAFGEESYKNGELNIEYLAENVFISKENVKRINAIVHPPTIKSIEELMNEKLKTTDLIFTESALIFESGIEELFDYIILIASSDELKFKRVSERDNLDEEEIKRRMENQMSENFKRENSDFVIENNGDLNDLESKVNLIINIIKSISLNNA